MVGERGGDLSPRPFTLYKGSVRGSRRWAWARDFPEILPSNISGYRTEILTATTNDAGDADDDAGA